MALCAYGLDVFVPGDGNLEFTWIFDDTTVGTSTGGVSTITWTPAGSNQYESGVVEHAREAFSLGHEFAQALSLAGVRWTAYLLTGTPPRWQALTVLCTNFVTLISGGKAP